MKHIIRKVIKENTALEEKWSENYKKSIDCKNPKGFSQKAHCQGRKKKIKEAHNEGLINYMFFSDLEQMMRQIQEMLTMDKNQVDQILQNGHDWAQNHITTSKDDIEEVYNFLKNYE